MQISVSVTLEAGEDLAYTPDAAAMQVLTALGGNPQEDHCICFVSAPVVPGEAGTPPEPEVPEEASG
jgi:hypothetical protein